MTHSQRPVSFCANACQEPSAGRQRSSKSVDYSILAPKIVVSGSQVDFEALRCHRSNSCRLSTWLKEPTSNFTMSQFWLSLDLVWFRGSETASLCLIVNLFTKRQMSATVKNKSWRALYCFCYAWQSQLAKSVGLWRLLVALSRLLFCLFFAFFGD